MSQTLFGIVFLYANVPSCVPGINQFILVQVVFYWNLLGFWHQECILLHIPVVVNPCYIIFPVYQENNLRLLNLYNQFLGLQLSRQICQNITSLYNYMYIAP
jgi:hypothetical protein